MVVWVTNWTNDDKCRIHWLVGDAFALYFIGPQKLSDENSTLYLSFHLIYHISKIRQN